MDKKRDDFDLNQQIYLVKTLRKIRLDANLRQTDLSQLLGLPQSYVSKYESGARQLNILEIRQICTIVGISLSKFVEILESALKDGGMDET
jgi:transcriptional regulator with XRE-family HTH domain